MQTQRFWDQRSNQDTFQTDGPLAPAHRHQAPQLCPGHNTHAAGVTGLEPPLWSIRWQHPAGDIGCGGTVHQYPPWWPPHYLHHFVDNGTASNSPTVGDLMHIMDHVLKNNVFEFEGELFQLAFETAMGTPMAPSLDSFFMVWSEEAWWQSALSSSPGVLEAVPGWHLSTLDKHKTWTGRLHPPH